MFQIPFVAPSPSGSSGGSNSDCKQLSKTHTGMCAAWCVSTLWPESVSRRSGLSDKRVKCAEAVSLFFLSHRECEKVR